MKLLVIYLSVYVRHYFSFTGHRSSAEYFHTLRDHMKAKRGGKVSKVSMIQCIVAEGITEVHNFSTDEQICPQLPRERRLAPCSSSPTASSCLLHWFRRSSALKKTQGG